MFIPVEILLISACFTIFLLTVLLTVICSLWKQGYFTPFQFKGEYIMNKITMMRIRELNSRILNQEGKIENASNKLKELKNQLNRLRIELLNIKQNK